MYMWQMFVLFDFVIAFNPLYTSWTISLDPLLLKRVNLELGMQIIDYVINR